MNMFGVSQEKYELEKFGYKKLSNIQEAMTAKVQKQLHGLNEEDRTVVKCLKKERDERTRGDYENMIRYFQKIHVFKKHGIDGGDLEKVIQPMTHMYAPKKTVIFKYQDEGDVFFIIISGKIQLWLPNPEIDAVKHERKDLECELEHVNAELKEFDGINMQ